MRVGAKTATDPEVKADAKLRVLNRNERDVVDLVNNIEARVTGDGALELARQVLKLWVTDEAFLNVGDDWAHIDELILGDAGNWRTEDDARDVTTGVG